MKKHPSLQPFRSWEGRGKIHTRKKTYKNLPWKYLAAPYGYTKWTAVFRPVTIWFFPKKLNFNQFNALKKWAIREQAEHTSSSITETQKTVGLEFLSQTEGEIPFLFFSDPPLQGNLESYRLTIHWVLHSSDNEDCVPCVLRCYSKSCISLITVFKVTSPKPHNIILHCILSYFRWYGYLAALPRLPK